jgi:hypothetical protein
MGGLQGSPYVRERAASDLRVDVTTTFVRCVEKGVEERLDEARTRGGEGWPDHDSSSGNSGSDTRRVPSLRTLPRALPHHFSHGTNSSLRWMHQD